MSRQLAKVKPGAVLRSPGISLMAKENPEKFQLGDCLMKSVVNHSIIVSNGVNCTACQGGTRKVVKLVTTEKHFYLGTCLQLVFISSADSNCSCEKVLFN